VKERAYAQSEPEFTFAGNDIVSPIDSHKITVQISSSAIRFSSMTGLTIHTSSEPFSGTIDIHNTPQNSRAMMSAPITSQRASPQVLGPINTNTEVSFPGLIPGLAGGLPGQQPVNAHQQQPTPPSTASHESTDERLNKLETLAANQVQEIASLRYISSASREEAQGLRMRIADLEGRLADSPSAIRLSPVSIKYNYSAMEPAAGHPKWETPAREKKRSRFATFFEQMAAASATSTPTLTVNKDVDATPIPQDKRFLHAALLKNIAAASATRNDSHGEKVEAVPVLKSTPSTAFTAHFDQIVTPPPSNHIDPVFHGDVDIDDDPFPWGGHFGRPDFDFAAWTPASAQYHEMDFYGWPSAPYVREMEGDADPSPRGRHIHAAPCGDVTVEDDPFPWGGRFGQPDFDFTVLVNPSTTGDAHGHDKEMQASGALHAPRPVRPRAPLLNRADL
jgi:hypothetical protein